MFPRNPYTAFILCIIRILTFDSIFLKNWEYFYQTVLNIIQQIMAKGKNGNEEATKIHLVDVSPNYGAAGQSDNLGKDPFGENYQEDTAFWKKVC